MPVNIEKYVGQSVEIIYEDSKGRFTQRVVAVFSVRGGKVRVLDWGKRAFRTLSASRILGARPVKHHAS
ncbi:hypothetical protein OMP38_23175 [Cohnella ginsengisoli]|uniref:Uncharacterized protein n=2 Tax=Bacillales TaxID=1385 RepID=A0A9X4QQ64_9BACL|nr:MULTISPECIES: hypothetical protein [Cohnella]MDG0793415.1 hypothetical protein [Cohnella ginsengisoli]SFB58485.1 hypothetical protein SAMN05216312_114231 [Cohnella sp. OV330]